MGLFGKKKQKTDEQSNHEVTLDDGSVITVNQVIDCIGDSCPRPQLMTKSAASKADSGAVMELKIDNPTSMEAIPPMMPELDATHLGTVRNGRYWQVLLRKN